MSSPKKRLIHSSFYLWRAPYLFRFHNTPGKGIGAESRVINPVAATAKVHTEIRIIIIGMTIYRFSR